jgi:AraC-like DNA-binding protein
LVDPHVFSFYHHRNSGQEKPDPIRYNESREVKPMDRSDQIRAVDQMQKYIADHLKEPITLSQLAAAASYSPFHAERIFKQWTGKTPFEYIRSLRLSQAALVLRDEDPKVVDVAFDFVFGSHEGFTKAFSKAFGLSPSRYAQQRPAIGLFLPWEIGAYQKHLEKGEKNMSEKNSKDFVFVQIVDRPRRKCLLKRGIRAEEYFAYCEEVGCDVWGVLCSVKEALYEPIGMWLPDRMIPEGTSKYVQGVELPMDYDKPIPAGFELVEMPPCQMMVFQGRPYDDADFEEEVLGLMNVIDEFDPSVYGYAWADAEAPRFQLAPMGYRGYIEARPVKPIVR